jgi:hypothetical protein
VRACGRGCQAFNWRVCTHIEALCGNHTNSQQQKRAAQNTRTLALALTLALTRSRTSATRARAMQDRKQSMPPKGIWSRLGCWCGGRSTILQQEVGNDGERCPRRGFARLALWPTRTQSHTTGQVNLLQGDLARSGLSTCPSSSSCRADALAHLPPRSHAKNTSSTSHLQCAATAAAQRSAHTCGQEHDTQQHNGFCLRSRRGRVWAHSPRGPRSDAIAPSIAILPVLTMAHRCVSHDRCTEKF